MYSFVLLILKQIEPMSFPLTNHGMHTSHWKMLIYNVSTVLNTIYEFFLILKQVMSILNLIINHFALILKITQNRYCS